MLSRVADALFWMSRYLERAEHVARAVDVTFQLDLDLHGVLGMSAESEWSGLLALLRMPPPAEAADRGAARVSRWVLVDPRNPGSVISCINRSRNNARSIRGSISPLMWRELNKLHWRPAEPGRQVQPGQPLMTVVTTHPWVEANFKETQLTALRPGQRAEVRLDAFPGRVLRGRVSSLAPAAGSRFALLPPDNATGNFTKVVQRVTARIDLDPRSTQGLDLVPGLFATVSVRRP